MNEPGPDPSRTFRRAFLGAYGLGLLLCVAWPLVLEGLLGALPLFRRTHPDPRMRGRKRLVQPHGQV